MGGGADCGQEIAFTERASAAMQAALGSARSRGNLEVTPLHLFLALFEEGGRSSIVRLMLKEASSEQRADQARQLVMEAVEASCRRLPVQSPPPDDLDMSGRLSQCLQRADQMRAEQGDEFVALDHLAVACVEREPVIQAALGEAGVAPKKMAIAAKALRGSRKVTSESSESSYQALATYARDLVEEAAAGRSGQIKPVVLCSGMHVLARLLSLSDRAGLILSSAERTKYGGWSRCSHAAPRIIPSWSESLESARLPSWRGSPSVYWQEMCRRR